jgi:hypothetical protein
MLPLWISHFDPIETLVDSCFRFRKTKGEALEGVMLVK